MTDILVITGLSGAGRSHAADDLEDLGWFVVDNLPVTLIEKVVELGSGAGSDFDKLALVVGPTADQSEVVRELRQLRSGVHSVRVLFLEATTPELVKRYGSTRRKHPLEIADSGITEAIERERALLEPVKAESDLIIDTTAMTVHQLKSRIGEWFSDDVGAPSMQIAVTSFGFKHGPPLDVDLVFDVRFLPNPHWVDELRPLTGLDEAVRNYVLEQPTTEEFLTRLEHLLELLIPAYAAEGKSYLSVAIGCTGGRHRSVAIAEQLAAWMRKQEHRPRVNHRDIAR